MTFDDQWVDEVRRAVKACAVFLWYPVYCMYLHITNVMNRTYRDYRVGVWADDQQSDLAGSHDGAERCTERLDQ
jgi:hypothetical protein